MKTNSPKQDNISLQQLEFPHLLETLSTLSVTPYGKTALEALSSSTDPQIVERWLSEVEEMVGFLEAGNAIPLSGFTDIEPYLSKIQPEDAYLDPGELWEFKNVLRLMGEANHFFKEHREEAPLLYEYGKGVHYHRQIVKEIEATVDAGGELFDNASPELRRIRIKIRTLLSQQKKVLTEVQKRYAEFSRDEIVTLRDGRLVLGILPSFVNKVSGVVHGTSATGATVFVEPMETLQISNQVQNLKIEERTEIIKILRFLTGLIRQVREDIFYAIHNLARLDVIYAKARLALQLRASKPKLINRAYLNIRDGRHPLLILKSGHQNVTPLNLHLGEPFHVLVITGPNAGGKTVALKTVGLLLLMTQYGLLIPAHPDSEIPLFPQILVDIGDRQSLEQDLSTFSAHIIRLRDICAAADQQSLVLLDEIGAGTDPKEGSALAIAILTELAQRNILTIATTHHGELKAFAHSHPGIENASMEFDLETLQPTYRLRIGIPGSSYAFAIARRYGLPEPRIRAAQELVGSEKDKLEELILILEARLQELEKKQAALSIKLSEAEAMRNLYQRQTEQLKRHKAELQRQAAEEARKILNDANALIERTVREIRESNADRPVIKSAKSVIRQEQEKLDSLLTSRKETPPVDTALRQGDVVWIESLGETGEILSAKPEKGKVQVLVGNVKMTLDVAGIRKMNAPAPTGGVEHRLSGAALDDFSGGVKPELDLRGMDCEQAIEETDRYLSAAIESGWEEVRIVHGKGSGALRKCINDFLSRDKRVLSKRLGKWGEGDTGVTVVRLKVGTEGSSQTKA